MHVKRVREFHLVSRAMSERACLSARSSEVLSLLCDRLSACSFTAGWYRSEHALSITDAVAMEIF